jgi:hypothetical protein
MSGELRIKFADWLDEKEMKVATGLILAFATTVSQDVALRTLTVVPHRGERELLKEYLAVWEADKALSWSDAD